MTQSIFQYGFKSVKLETPETMSHITQKYSQNQCQQMHLNNEFRVIQEDGNWKEIDEISVLNKNEGSIRDNFHRDTMWVSLVDTLYHDPNYPVDSLRYIPFGNGEEFTLLADSVPTKSGGQQFLFEARADFDQYLKGINEQEYNNYILGIKKNVTQVRREPVLDEKGEPKYDENNEEVVTLIPCRRVGNVKEPNNNAGNWE